MKNRLLSSKPIFVLTALLLVLVMASSTTAFASSTTGTTYSIAQATATPQYQCGEPCVPILIGYSYTGQGTCQTGCVGFPGGPIDATLTFSVTRTHPPAPAA